MTLFNEIIHFGIIRANSRFATEITNQLYILGKTFRYFVMTKIMSTLLQTRIFCI